MPIEVNGNAQEKRMVNLFQSKMIKKTISLLISFMAFRRYLVKPSIAL